MNPTVKAACTSDSLLGEEDATLLVLGIRWASYRLCLPLEQEDQSVDGPAVHSAGCVPQIAQMKILCEEQGPSQILCCRPWPPCLPPSAYSKACRASTSREYSSSTCTRGTRAVHNIYMESCASNRIPSGLTCTPFTPSRSISSVNTPGSLSMVVHASPDMANYVFVGQEHMGVQSVLALTVCSVAVWFLCMPGDMPHRCGKNCGQGAKQCTPGEGPGRGSPARPRPSDYQSISTEEVTGIRN